MIERLRGTLVGRSRIGVTIEVAGVGYEVITTPRTQVALPGIGAEVVVHTHLHGREDGITLYGFAAEAERDLFRVLITASGLGPKLGQAILGALSPGEVRRAIANEDVDALVVVPGVGRRSAQKIVLELKPKLEEEEASVVSGRGPGTELRQALEGLGYTATEIRGAVVEVDRELSVPDQIRTALQLLSRR